MFSSAHVYHACDRGISTVINNDHMLQHGDKWGTPVDGDAEQDWIATKENRVLNNYDETVKDEEHGRLPMSGAVVNYDYYVSEDKTVYQQGVETGKTSGMFDSYHVSPLVDDDDVASCVDFDGRGVRVDSESDNVLSGEGDSGGPIYDITLIDGVRKASIVGITSFGYDHVSDGDCYGGEQHTRIEGLASAAITDQGWDAPVN